MTKTDNVCPVCDSFKMSHDEFCKECQEQKDTIAARERQRRRDNAFGRLWPRK